jgi:hypothetical protein
MENKGEVVSITQNEDVFERYDSGLIAGFDHATGPDCSVGIVCAVTQGGVEVVAQYEQMTFDFRSTWAQIINLFKGGDSE